MGLNKELEWGDIQNKYNININFNRESPILRFVQNPSSHIMHYKIPCD